MDLSGENKKKWFFLYILWWITFIYLFIFFFWGKRAKKKKRNRGEGGSCGLTPSMALPRMCALPPTIGFNSTQTIRHMYIYIIPEKLCPETIYIPNFKLTSFFLCLYLYIFISLISLQYKRV